jgi:hypothetical protein
MFARVLWRSKPSCAREDYSETQYGLARTVKIIRKGQAARRKIWCGMVKVKGL